MQQPAALSQLSTCPSIFSIILPYSTSDDGNTFVGKPGREIVRFVFPLEAKQ